MLHAVEKIYHFIAWEYIHKWQDCGGKEGNDYGYWDGVGKKHVGAISVRRIFLGEWVHKYSFSYYDSWLAYIFYILFFYITILQKSQNKIYITPNLRGFLFFFSCLFSLCSLSWFMSTIHLFAPVRKFNSIKFFFYLSHSAIKHVIRFHNQFDFTQTQPLSLTLCLYFHTTATLKFRNPSPVFPASCNLSEVLPPNTNLIIIFLVWTLTCFPNISLT